MNNPNMNNLNMNNLNSNNNNKDSIKIMEMKNKNVIIFFKKY